MLWPSSHADLENLKIIVSSEKVLLYYFVVVEISSIRTMTEGANDMLEKITQAEWDAIHPDYKSVWTTDRTDWPNWAEVREQYMGKRTLMRGGSLGVEGISFEIVEAA